MAPGDCKPLLNRDPSVACRRCGMCCIGLSARISPETAKIISEENDIPKDKFCRIEKEGEGPNPNELVLSLPCRFLLGRPMSHVACRLYKKTRPDVCAPYLCRPAIQYKLGVIELDEALHILNRAYTTGDVGIFNWSGKTGEKELQQAVVMAPLREEAAKMVEDYGDDGRLGVLSEEEVGDILIAKSLTPAYIIPSDFAHLELNLLLSFFDRGDHELKDVIPQDVLKRWSAREERVAMEVYNGVMRKLRSLFKTVDEMKAAQIADEVVDQIEREEKGSSR